MGIKKVSRQSGVIFILVMILQMLVFAAPATAYGVLKASEVSSSTELSPIYPNGDTKYKIYGASKFKVLLKGSNGIPLAGKTISWKSQTFLLGLFSNTSVTDSSGIAEVSCSIVMDAGFVGDIQPVTATYDGDQENGPSSCQVAVWVYSPPMPTKPPVTPSVKPTGTPTPGLPMVKVIGYVYPDFTYSDSARAAVESGFTAATAGGQYPVAITDGKGKFEIAITDNANSIGNITISKPGYLAREIPGIRLSRNYPGEPNYLPVIEMWAGDMMQNGGTDGAINMADIMTIARLFNSVDGDNRYSSESDFNQDKAVNMEDIMIAARHYNATEASYTENPTPTSTPTSTPTVTPTTTPTPTSTSMNDGTIQIISPNNGTSIRDAIVMGMGIPIHYEKLPILVAVRDNGRAVRKVEYYREQYGQYKLMGESRAYPYSYDYWYPYSYPGFSTKFLAKVVFEDGSMYSSSPCSFEILIAHVDRYYTDPPTPTPTLRPSGAPTPLEAKIIPLFDTGRNQYEVRPWNDVVKVKLQDSSGKGIPDQEILWYTRYQGPYTNPYRSRTDSNGVAVLDYEMGMRDGYDYTDTLNICYQGSETYSSAQATAAAHVYWMGETPPPMTISVMQTVP